MAIRGIILDVSGTLIDLTRSRLAPGMGELLDFLRDARITPVLVSNDFSQNGLEGVISANRPFAGAIGLTAERVGKPKGSPLWIEEACRAVGCANNELVYVGDSRFDMITASQGRLVYFHSG